MTVSGNFSIQIQTPDVIDIMKALCKEGFYISDATGVIVRKLQSTGVFGVLMDAPQLGGIFPRRRLSEVVTEKIIGRPLRLFIALISVVSVDLFRISVYGENNMETAIRIARIITKISTRRVEIKLEVYENMQERISLLDQITSKLNL